MLARLVMRRWGSSILFLVLVLVIASGFACNQSTENPASPTSPSTTPNSGEPGSGTAAGTGLLSVRLTDSPFSDAEAVLVTFSEVSAHRAESGWETLPLVDAADGRTCDLKQLTGPVDVLGVAPLPAGHYTQIRLTVESATIFFDNEAVGGPCAPEIPAPEGDMASVKVPSGTIKLNREFALVSGGATTITLDFDGDKSIKHTGSGKGRGRGAGSSEYIMTPVIGVLSVQ